MAESHLFYLADPATNRPVYVAAAADVLAERERLVQERDDLPSAPLIVTLPRWDDATVDEQLACWHQIYAPLGLLSLPPEEVTAPAALVEKFSEWVDLDHQIAPRKPMAERRERRKPKPKPDPPKPPKPTAPPKPSPPKSKPKPKPKPRPRPATHGSVFAGAELRRCGECEQLGKVGLMKNHQKETGHTGEVRVSQDDPEVLALYERQKSARRKGGCGASKTRVRCDTCGMETIALAFTRHEKKSGHTERTTLM